MSERGSGRGGRRGGGRGGPLPRNVQVSKKISWLLRHGAEKEGLQLDARGYANVQEVLHNRTLKSLKVTFDELQACVADNDKQRFTMVPVAESSTTAQDGDNEEAEAPSTPTQHPPLPSSNPADYLIRANQGHSLKLDSEALLTPITPGNKPAQAIHGTTHSAYVKIVAAGGLKPMTRNHVHFAAGLPAGFKSVADDGDEGGDAAAPVISGMRNSSTILMYVDLDKAMQAGMKFWRSDNGVILSEGDEKGVVPLEMFKRVEDRTGAGVLVEEGKIVKEAPAAWGAKGKDRGAS